MLLIKNSHNPLLALFKLKTNIFQITVLAIIVQLILIIIAYPLVEVSRYFSLNSYIYSILINIILLLSIFIKDLKCKKLLITLCWFFIIWINIRVISLLYHRPENLEFIHPKFFNALEIENGLQFIFVANLMIILGIFLGKFLKLPSLKLEISDEIFTIKSQILIWLMVLIVFWFINVYLGTSLYSSPDKWGSKWGWIQSLLNPDVILAIQCIALIFLFNKKFSLKYSILTIILALTIFYLLLTYLGSRGGTFRVFTICLFILIAFSPYYKFNFLFSISAILTLVIIGVFTFNYGTSIRGIVLSGAEVNLKNVNAKMKLTNNVTFKGHWTAPKLTPKEKVIYLETEREKNKLVSVIKSIPLTIHKIINEQEFVVSTRAIFTRLNLLDYIIIIRNFPKDEITTDKYFRSTYAFKNFINNIVPGEIFDEATIKTNRLFSYLYRDFEMNKIKNYFQSEPFTLYGISILIGQKFSFLFLFLLGFLFRFFYSILPNPNNITNTSINYFYITYWSLLLSCFGLDHFFTVIAHASASLFFIISVIYIFKKICNLFEFKKVIP